jgi:hypothetical protein
MGYDWKDFKEDVKEGFDDTFGSGTDFNDSMEYINNFNIAWQLPKGLIEGKSVKGIFKKWADDVIHPASSSGKVLRTLGVLVAAYATGGAALNALGGKAAVSTSIGTMATASTPQAAMAAAPSASAITAASTGLSASAKGALALTAASTIASGYITQNASKRAEAVQRDGMNSSLAAQKESDDRYYAQLEQRRQDLSPYVQAGYEAMGYSPQEASSYVNRDNGGQGYGPGGMAPEHYQENPQGTQPAFREDGSPMPRGGKGPTAPGTDPAFAQNGAPISNTAPGSSPGRPSGGPPNLKDFGQGYNLAQPMQSSLLNAGQSSIPQLEGYAEGGMNAYKMQQDLAGVNGPDAQQAAYDVVESDPAYTYQMQKAEEAMTQNATATGGVRGGNVQGALAEFRPAFLSNAINQKYNQLAPMSAAGQNTSSYLAGAGGNVANTLYSGAQNTIGNIAQMGMSAAGGTPIGQSGTSPTANLMQQGSIADAGYRIQQSNNMANTLNTGMDNYFKYRQMFPNQQQTNQNAGYISPEQMAYNPYTYDNFQNTSPYQSSVGP